MTEPFLDHGDSYELDLRGARVIRCIIDHALSFELQSRFGLITIRLAGPFLLERAGSKMDLDPELHVDALGPVLNLCGGECRTVTIRKTGLMLISFVGQTQLTVPTGAGFEAWTLTIDRGPMVVSGPDGDLTFFDPAR